MIESETIIDIVSDIYVEASAGSLMIEPSSDDDVHISVSEKDAADLSVHLESERLTILLDQDQTFNLSRFNLFGNNRPQVTITLPDKVYDQLDIKLAIGEIDINGAEVNRLTAKNNVGAVNVSKTKTETAFIELNMGQISVAESTGEWTATTDVGEIDLQLQNFEEDITTEVGLGSIKITTKAMPSDYAIALEVDLGNIQTDGFDNADIDTNQTWQSQTGTNGPRIQASVDLGNLTLQYD